MLGPSLRRFREARSSIELLRHGWGHRTRAPGLRSRKKRGPDDVRVVCQPRAGLLAKLVKAGAYGGVGCRAGAEGGRGVIPLMD